MTLITAISVVVERMIPSSVKKLRSLLARKESKATDAASKNEAWEDCTWGTSLLLGYADRAKFVRNLFHPIH